MKHFLILFLLTLFFSVKGQKTIQSYFNDAGFCGPGPIIMEQIILFTDNSFEYTSCNYPNLRIEGSGRFSKKNEYIILEYEMIKIDTLDKSLQKKEITNLNLISEFKIIKDKQWLEYKSGMLIECGEEFGSKIKILNARKRRIITTKTLRWPTTSR